MGEETTCVDDLERALQVAERAIRLQPAAERVLEICRGDDPTMRSSGLAGDGHRVIEGYRQLREELRALRLPGSAADLDAVLSHHLELVGLALNLTYRTQTPRIQEQRQRLDGLGPSASHLRVLRDQMAARLAAQLPAER